jgi:predicted SnoaL-like aldol condensation-catalyzing enzyme
MDNKEIVVRGLTELFVNKDLTALDRYWGDPYIQHNPGLPDGTDAIKDALPRIAASPDFGFTLARAIADGDYVATHDRFTGFGPQPIISFDLVRLENGKIVEHWDGLQTEVTETASGNSMLDGETEIRDRDKSEANKHLVREFVESVFLRGEFHRLNDFLAGESYIQHNPNIPNGVSGLGHAIQEMARQGITMEIHKVHRIIGEGNFVLVQSEGAFAGKPSAFYDLFRVENGKIAEHWDVIQEIPTESKNANGMF